MIMKLIVAFFALFSVICHVTAWGAGKDIVFAGPPEGILSLPVFRMMETTSGSTVKFIPWNTPDQLRAIVAGGKADVVACHTHVAANLHNRGAQVRMLNITIWKLMWLVTATDSVPTTSTLADLDGKDTAVPLQGDLPDVVLAAIAGKFGVSYKPVYSKSSLDATQWLLRKRCSVGILPEPLVSNLLIKALEAGENDLHRGADVQELWGKAFNTKPRLPLAGIASVGGRIDDQQLRQFEKDYTDAAQWCAENPEEAAKLPSRQAGGSNVSVPGIARSLGFCIPQPESASRNRAEIEAFFKVIETQNPSLIGGKLPGDGFYFR